MDNGSSRTVSNILFIIERYYNGTKPQLILDEYEIDRITLDVWLTKYGETASLLLRLKNENEKLQKMYINVSLINQSLYEVLDDLKGCRSDESRTY